ncbi:MAG TPA: hypothetical protein VGP64_17225, partial [Polyangia bacterium]
MLRDLLGLTGLTGFTRRKPSRAGLASALVGIALGAAACGGGQPVARGYGSTEIEPLRDSTVLLYGQSSPGIVDYTTGTPAVWWTVDLATGAVKSYGSSTPPSSTPGPAVLQPFACNNEYTPGDSSGSFTLQIVDSTTNAEIDIPRVVSYANCPGGDRMLAAFVLDASGGLVLETGPFDQLAPVSLSVGVLGVVAWMYAGPATAPGPATGVTVLASSGAAPDEEELDTIALGTFDVTTAVPGVPASVAWATGAIPVGSLQSMSVVGPPTLIQPFDGHYIYPREMSDGGATIFAGPLAAGPASELALFELAAGIPLPPSTPVTFAPGDLRVPDRSLLTWQLDRGGGAASEMLVWDDTDETVASCPSIPGAYLIGTWSPDQSKLLFAVPQGSWEYYGSGGPLDLWTPGAAGGPSGCQQLVGNDALAADFSPDGDFMFWLEQPPSGPAQLWVAASDGTGARMIGSGEIAGAHFIGDGAARLEMILGGELDWLDLHDAAGTLHHVAEQVHGAIYDITGGHWLIMGYEWSTTDG